MIYSAETTRLNSQNYLSQLLEDNQNSLDLICERVFKLDRKIRSARIIGNKGKLVAGGMREGVKALEDPKKDEMLFMELSLRVRMRHEFDEEFGPVEFSLSYRGKIIMMSFPMGTSVLFVSSEKQIDLNKIPLKILEIIKSFPEILGQNN